jgi:CRISPR-associated protein Csx16
MERTRERDAFRQAGGSVTVYFISRHPGALDWARAERVAFDRHIVHLADVSLHPGDTVIGTLPVHAAAMVCGAGARFLSLSVDVPAAARGQELGYVELRAFGARLEEYRVERVEVVL